MIRRPREDRWVFRLVGVGRCWGGDADGSVSRRTRKQLCLVSKSCDSCSHRSHERKRRGPRAGLEREGGGRVVAVVVVVVGAGSLFEACLPALPARGASNETSGARAVMPSGTYIHATYSFESILVSSPRLVSAPTTSYGPLTSSATPLVGSPMIPVPAQPSPAHPIPSRLSPPARA